MIKTTTTTTTKLSHKTTTTKIKKQHDNTLNFYRIFLIIQKILQDFKKRLCNCIVYEVKMKNILIKILKHSI
jgi:hypothetical protein